MTCTRTGAQIWIEPYSEWMYGDAFEVPLFADEDIDAIHHITHFVPLDYTVPRTKQHLNTYDSRLTA